MMQVCSHAVPSSRAASLDRSVPWHPDRVIRVVPIREAWADALAEGDDVFSHRFDVAVENGWAGFPEVVPFLVSAAHSAGLPAWGPHLVLDEDGTLVGNAGGKDSRSMAPRSWATQSRVHAKAGESQRP